MLNELHPRVEKSSMTLLMNAKLFHYLYKGIHYDSKVNFFAYVSDYI